MAIPPEFNYIDEDDFIQRFLIPLLQRLGFSLVVNYHGRTEFGKDLIFAELDRFAHVRYHAIQAKYEPSISLNGVETLITDCKQAFANPFKHPQTGSEERISSFYAVNGGTIGSEAMDHFFNSLRPTYSGNVRLLQAKDLLTIDRWASVAWSQDASAVVEGLRLECLYNMYVCGLWIRWVEQSRAGEQVGFPIQRLRISALSSYMIKPSLQAHLAVESALAYLMAAEYSAQMMHLITQGLVPADNRDNLKANLPDQLIFVRDMAQEIGDTLSELRDQIAPIARV